MRSLYESITQSRFTRREIDESITQSRFTRREIGESILDSDEQVVKNTKSAFIYKVKNNIKYTQR